MQETTRREFVQAAAAAAFAAVAVTGGVTTAVALAGGPAANPLANFLACNGWWAFRKKDGSGWLLAAAYVRGSAPSHAHANMVDRKGLIDMSDEEMSQFRTTWLERVCKEKGTIDQTRFKLSDFHCEDGPYDICEAFLFAKLTDVS